MKSAKEDMGNVYIDEALVEKGYQRCLEGEDNIAQAAALERHGGPCPICGVPFNVVFVDNQFGSFNYYQPSCRCFKRCESVKIRDRKTGHLDGYVKGCGRWLIAERLVNIGYCTHCNAEDPDPKPKEPRLPKRKEIVGSGKDLSTGERADS